MLYSTNCNINLLIYLYLLNTIKVEDVPVVILNSEIEEVLVTILNPEVKAVLVLDRKEYNIKKLVDIDSNSSDNDINKVRNEILCTTDSLDFRTSILNNKPIPGPMDIELMASQVNDITDNICFQQENIRET